MFIYIYSFGIAGWDVIDHSILKQNLVSLWLLGYQRKWDIFPKIIHFTKKVKL